jgi:hypothetical protein
VPQGRARRSYFARIAEYIGIPLRQERDNIAREPLPERWVDLINYLDAQEQAEARPRAKRWPPFAPEP